ncbi:transposase [Amorphoplanes auranticolor]|uniref:Transposase n=1 Tax=Actinoplanes auranticolor TaxID=47988 RepID=A0A919SST9_9ACTN|nr:transposase [Actinoplanes auranticolor]
MFDEDNLVSHAGLVPLLALAERTGLSELLDEHVRFACERVKSGAANPTPKLTSIIAGMACGADSIDDLDVIRAGGMKRLFDGVYAATTLGILLREFTHGHTRQLSAVLRRHLVALTEQTRVLHGITDRCFIDIDSLLRPVYGRAKQGASFGHTKISGKTVLRRGLSPLAVTISTETAAPMLAGVRLRAGRAASSRGAASMVTEALNTAITAGATPQNILIRGDSAYCAGTIVTAIVTAGARFSITIARNPAVDAAIADNRHRITGRLIVRRVLDANTQDPLFPVWRYHPFFTNTTEPVDQADITHRRHAICETVWSDLIDGPWAHQPSGMFTANTAWCILAAICHNLLRAAGTLTDTTRYTVARGATLRTHLINIPARLARPQHHPTLHLPTHWPRAHAWLTLWTAAFTT